MNLIALFVFSAGPGFQDERDVLGGPVRAALDALVAPYDCRVEFVATAQDDAVRICLAQGACPPAPDASGSPIYFVRTLVGDAPVAWHVSEERFSPTRGSDVHEYTAVAEGECIPDLSEFEAAAVAALSPAVVARATSIGSRTGVPDDPGTALRLAITLLRIGDTARDRDEVTAANAAYSESLAVLRETAPGPEAGDERELHSFLLEELEAAERMKQSRGSGEPTAGLSSLPVQGIARSRWWSFTARTPRPADVTELRERRRGRGVSVAGRRGAASVDSEDVVNISVFAPPRMSGGSTAMIQVFVHLPDDADAAASEAAEFDDEATRRGVHTLSRPVGRSEQLGFRLSVPGMEVPDALQYVRWTGRSAAVQFEAIAPETVPVGQSRFGRVEVSRNGIPIGYIRFKITFVSPRTPSPLELTGDESVSYRSAFISYAHQDRPEVLKRVQLLRSLHIEYFQDIDFRPGDNWKEKVYERIEACDVLLLFWSTSAKESAWVREEVRYAQGLGDRAPVIRPVIIEAKPPLPWEEVAHIHFDDRILGLL